MIRCMIRQLISISILVISSQDITAQSDQAVRYVQAQTNSTCPGEPCLLLNQYASQAEEYFTSNSIFLLDVGDHTLPSSLTLAGVNSISFQGQLSNDSVVGTNFVCTSGASVAFVNARDVILNTIVLENCNFRLTASNPINFVNVGFVGGKNGTNVAAWSSNLTFTNSLFANGSAMQGGGLYANNSHVSFKGGTNFLSNVASLEGGAMSITDGSSVEFTDIVTLENNTAPRGGGISCTGNSTMVFDTSSQSTFTMNTATLSYENGHILSGGGGGVFLSSSLLLLNGSCGFEHNRLVIDHSDDPNDLGGGAIRAVNGSRLFINDHNGFTRNTAPNGGGLHLENSALAMSGNILFLGNIAERGNGGGIHLGPLSSMVLAGKATFLGNMASKGGGGVATRNASSVNINGALFLHNEALETSGGAIRLLSCPNALVIDCNFTANTAYLSGGALHAGDTVLTLGTLGFFKNNIAGSGGAMSGHQSTINFMDGHHLENNMAVSHGSGAIQLTFSSLHINGNTTFYNNTGYSGGCVQADQSEVDVRGEALFQNNTALYQGGVLFVSEQSVLSISGFGTTMSGNSAREGGAVALENGARMILESPLQLNVKHNVARAHGGGIFHADHVTVSTCAGEPSPATLPRFCFLEISGVSDDIGINFTGNSAMMAGSVLYGGGLDHCHIQSTAANVTISMPDSVLLFESLSTIQPCSNDTTSTISSTPLEICFCDDNGDYNCSKTVQDVEAYPGELISLPAITLGQGGGAVPSSIHISLNEDDNLFTSERTQRTGKVCASLEYRVYSFRKSELLTVHPEGGCGDVGPAHRDVHVNLLPCPPGFSLSNMSHGCICEEILNPDVIICDIDSLEFTLNKRRWLSSSYDNNGTYLGLLLSSQCPSIYCAPPPLRLTLADPDVQCLHNRSGILCGGCVEGSSLALGSQHCLSECSNSYLALLIPFALAGIVLVACLLLLNLTVAEGTGNGLLLYANLVQINGVTLLPSGTNILTVFIAWLNLDLGIETCFYDGMDAYPYNWLQFVFPLYLITLMGVVSFVCSRSKKLANYLGPRPRAVFATVVLLCYSKMIRAAAMGLYVSKIDTVSSTQLVWRVDGHFRYFKDYRHAILGTVSLLVLLGGLSFSVLLLFWNALSSLSSKKLLPQLNLFVQSYHQPLLVTKFSWVGLLLIVRLFLTMLTIPYYTNETNALVTLITVSIILLVHAILRGGLYKITHNLVLESFFLVNLLVFLGTTFYFRMAGLQSRQEIVANFFLGLAFVQFLGIWLYHVYLNFFQGTVLLARLKRTLKSKRTTGEVKNEVRGDEPHKLETSLSNTFEFTLLEEPLLN